LTNAYLEKGWKVIAAIRDPKKMPSTEGKGEVVVVKYDAGEKDDAKKVSPRWRAKWHRTPES
jgi:hypothetical protein